MIKGKKKKRTPPLHPSVTDGQLYFGECSRSLFPPLQAREGRSHGPSWAQREAASRPPSPPSPHPPATDWLQETSSAALRPPSRLCHEERRWDRVIGGGRYAERGEGAQQTATGIRPRLSQMRLLRRPRVTVVSTPRSSRPSVSEGLSSVRKPPPGASSREAELPSTIGAERAKHSLSQFPSS